MRRFTTALLALACLATGVACTVALYTLPRLLVPVAAQPAPDSATMPAVRTWRPFTVTEYGTTLACISNRAAQLDPPILWAPTPTPLPLNGGTAPSYPAPPPYVP